MHMARRSLTNTIILVMIVISGNWKVCLAQQDSILDSLLKRLQMVKEDTGKVNVLNELSYHLIHSTMHADAKKYAEEALFISEKSVFKNGIAEAYFNLGIFYKNKGNYPEAFKKQSYALKIFEEINHKRGIAGSYIELGNINNEQGSFNEALRNYSAALKINEEIGNNKGIASSYNNVGMIYNKQGNYAEALKYYFASLKISEKIGIKSRIATSYNNIGNTYKNQGNNSEALKYLLLSLKIREELGDKKGIANSYTNIGNIYRDQGDYSEALKIHQLSLKIKEEIGDKKGTGMSYNSIGNIYNIQGNYSEALKNYETSLKIKEEIGDKSGIANTYKNIGTIYYDQGNYLEALKNYQASLVICDGINDQKGIASINVNLGQLNIKLKKLDEARKYLKNGLELSKKLGVKEVIKDAYLGLTDLDSIEGNHNQALEHFMQYTIYKDSLLNESNNKVIAEMKTKYETEKKDKEIQKLEAEKQIDSLQLKVQQESLNSILVEKDKLQIENLYNLQQVELLDNEKHLQQLQLAKNQADLIAQKAETDRKHNQVTLLNKEREIQKLELKRQSLLKNYLIGGIVLLGLLSFFVYKNYSTRQKLKLQTLRNKIASDLHDDVGSTLTSISIFSQIAKEQSKEVIPLLDSIGESSRKMLDAMADIVWTINPENDQFEKIILRMRSFAYELLGAKGIDFEFSADENISKLKLSMEVRKNLYLIFKEATNNIVKYAEASKAMFTIKEENDNLKMIIRDNGKGFDVNKTIEGNGLKNMKKRATEIGAQLLMESHPGSGTMIQLKVAV
jgi:two-component system sensor histidine kinase UhpB